MSKKIVKIEFMSANVTVTSIVKQGDYSFVSAKGDFTSPVSYPSTLTNVTFSLQLKTGTTWTKVTAAMGFQTAVNSYAVNFPPVRLVVGSTYRVQAEGTWQVTIKDDQNYSASFSG
jgi:hypothetical protein